MIFSDDILWKVAHIVKGFLVVVIFSVVIVEEDGIIAGDEGVKMPINSAVGSGFVYFPEEDPSNSLWRFWAEPGGLGTLLGKIPGVNIPFKCVISPEVIPCPTAHNRPLPRLQNSVGTFRYLKISN